jgi:hypothetical protein
VVTVAVTNVRKWLTEQLAPQLEGYVLMPWDQGFTPSAPTVMFYRSSVTELPDAPRSGAFVNTITMYVAVPTTIGAEGLDELDGALDEVLVALHNVKGVVLVAATYEVLNDTVPCFKVLVEVTSSIRSTTSEEDN